jgi:hypothetical protein
MSGGFLIYISVLNMLMFSQSTYDIHLVRTVNEMIFIHNFGLLNFSLNILMLG